LHEDSSLFDFVGREALEVVRETTKGGEPDDPLGWVILVELDGVTVVGWELVVAVLCYIKRLRLN
jgi:hypothetical protein